IDYLINKGVINKRTLFFIFSDDIEWCKDNIFLDNKTYFVQGDTYHVELDMLLMSKCKHNIISNSSFSWWAAWLNENRNKIVIAPSKWFKKDIKHDIIPESWVKL
ncbi:alpha-1,2-fucosyltransferase, partial [Escherichia albertii]